MTRFLGLPDLAKIAGISERAAEKAAARAIAQPGSLWRNTSLVVRKVRGRGGLSGQRYEVRLDSLPAELQLRCQAALQTELPLFSQGPEVQQEREFRRHVIAAALAHPKGSIERGEAIRQAAAQERWRPGRKPFRVSERSIQRWIDAAEKHGDAGLGRRKRADAGEAAVILSRAWDKAVPFNEEAKERIAEELCQYVRGLTKKGMNGAQLNPAVPVTPNRGTMVAQP